MKIEKVDKTQISFDPQNPRSKFMEEDIDMLVKSIEDDGQQEPVHLEKLSENEFLVNEGNKRVAAILKSKIIKTVNAIIEQKLSPEQRLFKQIIIDTHRKNWGMSDRDNAWKRLWEMGKYDAISFAKKLSVTKGIVESFLDRMELGADFMEEIKNVSAYNITETARMKDKELRKKVLKHANKNELRRKDIRKLATIAEKLNKDVINDVINDKITIDDASNFVGLNEERQKQALETTKVMNNHKKKLKTMLTDGSVKTDTLPFVEDASKKVTRFQQMFFKTASDLRVISEGLNSLSKEETKKYLNPQMVKILSSCLSELKTGISPAIKTMEKILEDLQK